MLFDCPLPFPEPGFQVGVISSLSCDDIGRWRWRVGSPCTAASRLSAFFFFFTGARFEPRFAMDCDWGTTMEVVASDSSQCRTMKRLMNSSKAAISSSASC